jgi:hypothetical protein
MQLILPELFYIRYSKYWIWNAILASSQGDSTVIKKFFENIDQGKFGTYPQKEIVLKYIDFGLDVAGTYISSILTIGASLALLIAFREKMLVILLSLVLIAIAVIMILEFPSRVSDRKVDVYRKSSRWKIKLILVFSNVMIIAVPLLQG